MQLILNLFFSSPPNVCSSCCRLDLSVYLVVFDKCCRRLEEALIQADSTAPCFYAPRILWPHQPQKGLFERPARLGTFLGYQKEQFFTPAVCRPPSLMPDPPVTTHGRPINLSLQVILCQLLLRTLLHLHSPTHHHLLVYRHFRNNPTCFHCRPWLKERDRIFHKSVAITRAQPNGLVQSI